MKLNKAQKQLTSDFDGATVALAIPGSGKTHTLTDRILNMVSSDQQINPSDIICLTFTENASKELRARLLKKMNSQAYAVHISTFHSFASEIISENSDYFGIKNLEVVSGLEIVEIFEEIIDELPKGNPLIRYKGDKYFEVSRLKRLFEYMQSERVTSEMIEQHCNDITDCFEGIKEFSLTLEGLDKAAIKEAIEYYISENPNAAPFIYKRNGKGFTQGSLKVKDAEAIKSKYDVVIAASKLLPEYIRKMEERGRYSFADMISWVIKMFEEDEGILAKYQEQFQFLLIDESQDVNESQFAIVNNLLNYWNDPNVLIVGDLDQNIMGFAGARSQNITDFIDKYNPKIVKMNQNYRSNQRILDHAHGLISNISALLSETEFMVAAKETEGDVVAYEFNNFSEETAFIYSKIKELIASGVKPGEIAVVYRKHAQADSLMKVLHNDSIPILAKKKINILEENIVKQILNILDFVNRMNYSLDSGNLFAEIIHYDFFELTAVEIEGYLINHSKPSVNKHTDSGVEVSFPENTPEVLRIKSILSDFIASSENISPLLLVEKIMNETGIISMIASGKDKQKATIVVSWFNWLKEEHIRCPDLTISDLLEKIRRMKSNKISINIESLMHGETGVNFVTAHSSKGSEFEHVFLIRSNRSDWEKGSGNMGNYSLPGTLTLSDSEEDFRAQQRLFYVAMTRAKKYLYISCSKENDIGKRMEATVFIEMANLELQPIEEVDNLDYIIKTLVPERIEFNPAVDREILEAKLENYRLSPSHMIKYEKCPLSFYYENVLRIPYLKTRQMTQGDAAHYASETYYNQAKKKIILTAEEYTALAIDYMERNRGLISVKDSTQAIAYLSNDLPIFYEKYIVGSNLVTVNEYKAKDIVIEGVPVTIIIDKLEFDGNFCDVVDYKTGSEAGIKTKLRPDGDIWSQLVFYDLGIRNDKKKVWDPRGLKVVPISKDYTKPLEITIDNNDRHRVVERMQNAYNSIKALKFDGCGDPDCKSCNMVKNR